MTGINRYLSKSALSNEAFTVHLRGSEAAQCSFQDTVVGLSLPVYRLTLPVSCSFCSNV